MWGDTDMAFNYKVFASALALAGVLGLAGCGSSDKQDEPKNGGGSRVVSARAIDGYLVRATVWADLNGNGKLEAFEPRAFTDDDGYFSYNHLTGTDYCAADASAAQARFCLRLTGVGADEPVLLRVRGGYDSATGLPFKGMLSMRTSDLDPSQPMVVTPLTSLLAEAPSDASNVNPDRRAAGSSALDALINSGLITGPSDAGADTYAGSPSMFFVSQMLQLLNRTLDTATETVSIHQNFDVGAYYSGFNAGIMGEIVGAGGLAGRDFSAALLVEDDVAALMQRILAKLSLLNPDMSETDVKALLRTLARSVSELAAIAGLLDKLPVDQFTAQQRDAVARSFALVMEVVRNNPGGEAADRLIAWLNNQVTEAGIGSDLLGLGGDDVDISLLIDATIDPSSNTVSAMAKLPEAVRNVFSSVVNTSVGVKVDKNDERGAALLFVFGEAGATSGDIKLCVRYQDDSGDFDTGSASDPNGALLLNGHWSLFDNHSVVLAVDVVGGARPLMVKAVGANGGERTYRFDFGSDLTEWSGTAPRAFSPGDVPVNDQDCRDKLIAQFGPVG